MTKESAYQGKPTIQLYKDVEDRFPFTFGLVKAKLILQNFAEIEAFVAKHDKEAT